MLRGCHLLAFSCLFAAACTQPRSNTTYTLDGQILAIDTPRKMLNIKHGDIKGLMPAMTMPYTVHDTGLLKGLAAGDLIEATLVVESNDAYLSAIRKTGQAPLAPPPPDAPAPVAAAAPLQPGDAAPDALFVDQNGRRLRFATFKGAPLVMTFIYTRCPLPDFCPLMDRHFAAIQQTIESDPALAAVHLVTVSFDPAFDSPAVLRRHGKELGANFARWTFLTGDRDDIDRFASRFGVAVSRAANDPRDVTHNLRTAVLDGNEHVVKIYSGNEWTVEQVLADLRSVIRDSGFGIRKPA